jgi:hypothetical protein
VDKRSLVLYLSGLAAAGAVVGLAASCSDQPRIKCTAGHGPFAVVYTPMGGSDPCGLSGDTALAQLGVEAYNDPLPDKSNLDPNKGSLGMQPFDFGQGARSDDNTAHLPYSLGPWATSEPAADNFCVVSNPNDIQQDFAPTDAVPPGPDGGGAKPYVPSLSVKYHWSNVRFYNTPAAPGTQLIADLAYTRTDGLPDGGTGAPCTQQYHAVGLWPLFSCAVDPEDPSKGTDPTLCSPFADPSKNRPVGSGISPDLATRCDDALQLCVLVNEPR